VNAAMCLVIKNSARQKLRARSVVSLLIATCMLTHMIIYEDANPSALISPLQAHPSLVIFYGSLNATYLPS
jgi:hypothetical protein